jgi:hypothetical protein
MLLGVFIGSFDALMLMMNTFSDIHLLSPTQVLAVNAVLGFLIVPAKLIKQEITATTEQKVELINAAAAQPIAAGQPDVTARVVTVPPPTIASTIRRDQLIDLIDARFNERLAAVRQAVDALKPGAAMASPPAQPASPVIDITRP